MTWRLLGAVAPENLVDARLQLHHAAQLAASAGVTFLEPQPDDSHPNMIWIDEFGALLGRPLPVASAGANANASVQVGLRVSDLSLIVIDAGAHPSEEFALDGKSLDEAYDWLAGAASRAGLAVPSAGLARPDYVIPVHPTGAGSRFALAPNAAFAELGRWFENGQRVLGEWVAQTSEASELRCWPHHFDLGTLAVVAKTPDGGLAKSIGVGLSPGDESYAEPYFYVSPWPYPNAGELPALEGGGVWHTEGYTAAILKGSALLDGAPEAQADRLDSFLACAVEASRRSLVGSTAQ